MTNDFTKVAEAMRLRVTYRIPRLVVMSGRLVSISFPHDPPRFEMEKMK